MPNTTSQTGGFFMVMKEGQRINLRPYLQEFKTRGFPIEPTRENLQERYCENAEQKVIDLYTFLVPVIADVVSSALLHTPSQNGSSLSFLHFSELAVYAKGLLKTASHQYANTHVFPEAFNLLAAERAGSVEYLVNRGIETATASINCLLGRVPIAYQRKYHDEDVTEQKLITVASDNYPFIATLAKLHLVHVAAVSSLGESKYARSFETAFSYMELDVNDHFFMPEQLRQKLPKNFGSLHAVGDFWGDRGTIGCPAIYSPALKSLWDWHLPYAATIYRTNLGHYKEMLAWHKRGAGT